MRCSSLVLALALLLGFGSLSGFGVQRRYAWRDVVKALRLHPAAKDKDGFLQAPYITVGKQKCEINPYVKVLSNKPLADLYRAGKGRDFVTNPAGDTGVLYSWYQKDSARTKTRCIQAFRARLGALS